MPDQDLQQQLTKLYDQQLIVYRQLAGRARSLEGQDMAGPGVGTSLMQVGELMARIAAVDDQIRPVREAWRETGEAAGTELVSKLQQLEKVIVQVMQYVQNAEHAADQIKSRLEPQLTSEVRHRKMATAYSEVLSRE